MKKSKRELERILKGVANHNRLKILELLGKKPNLSVQEISSDVNSDFKNISAHINKMYIAGLVKKRSEGSIVRHTLSKRGKSILQFVRIIE
ncbi:MAG: winged helix-turn-helix domain-containing protein [Candidatus Paceibacterota bacterium]|jgi:DNA-binding transcriptional ArsR family regulator